MRSLAVLGLCSLVCACQPSIPPATLDLGPPVDANRVDMGVDAPAADLGPPMDAFGDAGPGDGGFSPSSCHFDATMDLFDVATDSRARPVRVAVAAGPSSFGIAYSAIDMNGFENVNLAELPTAVGSPIAHSPLTSDFFTTTAPTITRTSVGWLLAWLSNKDGNVEVYSLGSATDGRLATTPTRVTTTPSISEHEPALAATATSSVLAWFEPGTASTAVVRAIGTDGTVSGTPTRIAPTGLSPQPDALTSTDFGFVLGWCDADADATVVSVDAMGANASTPAALTPTSHDCNGTIAAAVSHGGGAAVFDADNGGRPEVHAHALDGAGGAIGAESVLTVGVDTGGGASVAELGGGYVVAYRQSGTPAQLRLLFLSSVLVEVQRLDVTALAAATGPMTIRVAGDGTVLVAWAEIVGTTTHFRAARIRCG
jgi:hypothetical protein